jgi:hypothetical protein
MIIVMFTKNDKVWFLIFYTLIKEASLHGAVLPVYIRSKSDKIECLTVRQYSTTRRFLQGQILLNRMDFLLSSDLHQGT